MSNNSIISRAAHFDIEAPFRFRFIVPYSLGLVMPDKMLDARWLRITIALLSVVSILRITPLFVARLLGRALSDGQSLAAQSCMWLLLIMHYCMPRELNVYYVYDLISILMYQIVFLSLTEKLKIQSSGIVLALIASLNRETIIIAVLHAMVFCGCGEGAVKQRGAAILKLAMCAFAILFVRWVVSHFLSDSLISSVAPYENGHLRFFANFEKIVHSKQHRLQILMIGAGIVFWLPFAISGYTVTIRRMHWVSIFVIVGLSVVGNLSELRMYNEFLPLWAASLYFWLTDIDGRFKSL